MRYFVVIRDYIAVIFECLFASLCKAKYLADACAFERVGFVGFSVLVEAFAV
ncbi:hypothetical protein MAH1_02900 [Sessilibacter sp. MAH1]